MSGSFFCKFKTEADVSRVLSSIPAPVPRIHSNLTLLTHASWEVMRVSDWRKATLAYISLQKETQAQLDDTLTSLRSGSTHARFVSGVVARICGFHSTHLSLLNLVKSIAPQEVSYLDYSSKNVYVGTFVNT